MTVPKAGVSGPLLSATVQPDAEGLLACIRREPTRRVHHVEVLVDPEVVEAVCARYDLAQGLDTGDPFFGYRRYIAFQSFLGYDYAHASLRGFELPLAWSRADDTAPLPHAQGRHFVELGRGPISGWQEFESYPWPDPAAASTDLLDWYEENLPEGMCVIGLGGFGHFAEHLTWLMGYEALCVALCEQRDLVAAISRRLEDLYAAALARVLQFDRVRIIWCADDMGFRGGTLVSPDDLREFVLPGHRRLARMAHAAGRPYLLHTCGDVSAIMDDLVGDVGIDGKHSFQDGVADVVETKRAYGDRIAVLGGIDLDFLCRATAEQVRERVRRVLGACMPGGGYCLGTGNSVTNYIPLENYLAMVDEGRRLMG